MFFIFGISNREEKLNFSEMAICPCCDSYARVEVFCTYSYFSLFFIPLFKWSRRYYIRLSCCAAEAEIPKELGKAIRRGEVSFINIDNFSFSGLRRCKNCGYFPIDEGFEFCPKCGTKL